MKNYELITELMDNFAGLEVIIAHKDSEELYEIDRVEFGEDETIDIYTGKKIE